MQYKIDNLIWSILNSEYVKYKKISSFTKIDRNFTQDNTNALM